jgi:hypothetical protein
LLDQLESEDPPELKKYDPPEFELETLEKINANTRAMVANVNLVEAR